jgi:hypothetical protein
VGAYATVVKSGEEDYYSSNKMGTYPLCCLWNGAGLQEMKLKSRANHKIVVDSFLNDLKNALSYWIEFSDVSTPLFTSATWISSSALLAKNKKSEKSDSIVNTTTTRQTPLPPQNDSLPQPTKLQKLSTASEEKKLINATQESTTVSSKPVIKPTFAKPVNNGNKKVVLM